MIVNVLNTASLFRLRVIEGALQRHYRTRGYPWLPLVALVLDGCLLVAFVLTNHRGALFGGGLILLTVPVWLLLRRGRRAVEV
jgi:hypothetical protein